MASVILISASMLGGSAGWAKSRYGSLADGLAVLNGRSFYVDQPDISLGEVPSGSDREVTFQIVNRTGRTYRIVGCTSTCGCAAIPRLPIPIPPGRDNGFTIAITPRSGARIPVEFHLYTDNPGAPDLSLRISSREPVPHSQSSLPRAPLFVDARP